MAEDKTLAEQLKEVVSTISALSASDTGEPLPDTAPFVDPDEIALPDFQAMFTKAFPGAFKTEVPTKGQKVRQGIQRFLETIDPNIGARASAKRRQEQIESKERFKNLLDIYSLSLRRAELLQSREDERARITNLNIKEQNKQIAALSKKKGKLTNREMVKLVGPTLTSAMVSAMGLRGTAKDPVKIEKDKVVENTRDLATDILTEGFFKQPPNELVRLSAMAQGKIVPNIPIDVNTPEGLEQITRLIESDFFRSVMLSSNVDPVMLLGLLRPSFPGLASNEEVLAGYPKIEFVDKEGNVVSAPPGTRTGDPTSPAGGEPELSPEQKATPPAPAALDFQGHPVMGDAEDFESFSRRVSDMDPNAASIDQKFAILYGATSNSLEELQDQLQNPAVVIHLQGAGADPGKVLELALQKMSRSTTAPPVP